jgi:shikimate kinase
VNLFLIGYRGSGKSAVGELVARRLNWPFTDLDELVERRTSRKITDIFKDEGEPAFRQYEKEALESIRRTKHQVIALGGGALTYPDVRVLVKKMGKAVWLQAPPAILHARIQRDVKMGKVRPDLKPGGGLPEIEAALAEREGIYKAAATHAIDVTTASPEDVADSIELWFRANDAESEG